MPFLKRACGISIIKSCMTGMIFCLLSACNGLFENIYDNPDTDKITRDYGFIEVDKINNSGTIYVNATSYTQWMYINFHTQSIDSMEISDEMVDPKEWDIAIHRYDAKTNGATVLETEFTDLSIFKEKGKVPEGDYLADIWTTNKVIIDMSGMMEGILKYANTYYNAELSKWLHVDTSNMPPNYTPSDKVYVIKLKDNSVALVKLKDFMNTSGIKGYMTIQYIYPFLP